MPGHRPGSPKVLVLGGSGAIGAGVVELARALGWQVTATGRSAPSALLQARLLDPLRVPYESVDLNEERAAARLRRLLAEHELVVLACEPWSEEAFGGSEAVVGVTRLYKLARLAGFEVCANRERAQRGEPQRRIVRVGSSAAELPHALIDGSRRGWPENRVSLDALETLARTDACWNNHYFRTKVALARAACEALQSGVDVVTALPTYVVSWWGDRGRAEPLVHAYRVARGTGFLPSTPVNAIPVDVAATGILLVGLSGRPGERYQLCGVETDTHAIHTLSLRHLGLHPRPFPVPRHELVDEVRLLSGRSRRNPWLDLWLLPWDIWRRAALSNHDVEAWHVALLLEGSQRDGAKVRSLNRVRASRILELRYPDEAEIQPRLEVAARRKIEWLKTFGPPGATTRTQL